MSEEGIEAGQFFPALYPAAGGKAFVDEATQGFQECGLLPDHQVEFGGLLQREDVHVAGAGEHDLLVEEEKLGMDHGFSEVDLDLSLIHI